MGAKPPSFAVLTNTQPIPYLADYLHQSGSESSLTAAAPSRLVEAAPGSPKASAAAAPSGAGTASAEDNSHKGDDLGFPGTGEHEDRALVCVSRSVASASATTSIEALSAPASPHCDVMHSTTDLNPSPPLPPLQQQQQQQRPRAGQPQQQQQQRRKAISSHIAGTGAFLVVYEQPARGAGDGAFRSTG